ncbi:hypothetical protein Aeqsu_0386 [Aequorivita sublithincola DSM 14238]|uniref:GLPGLI family protein n=1 Tax=Aequorivita sublithincola (strain DSM 14238 / LMG 21431 / ACAM 643 / 9-3) TaxID=746697 RepID=I3YSD1_AEQSU|nr:hypothetical protein [Aequorivita sublithincola]AFL79899.1 hypothetical protein Aeqsu_0386 [Aequorivita sublithincola DSM 14238]
MTKFLLYTLFICLTASSLFAQHIKLDKKEMAFLATQEKVNVVFTYEGLRFNADTLTEPQFVNYIKEKIENKLDAKEALDWEKRYFNAKDSIYPKIFATALNNRIKNYDHPIEFVVDDDSVFYTMKVQTDWMYFGYDVGIAKQPAKANLKITFFETSNPENIIAKIDVDRAEGFNVVGNLSFNTEVPLSTTGISSTNWLKKFLEANEDYPRPSLLRMGNMYDKAAVRFGMTLKRVID